MAQLSVGLFLYTRSVPGSHLRAVVHRRGAMRLETPDSPRNPFAWGLQALCRGPLEPEQNPLDALWHAISVMFDTSADIMPKEEKHSVVLSRPNDRMLIYGWELRWDEIQALRIGACTGSVTTFFRKQAAEIRPVQRAERDSIDARKSDAMLGQEHVALMNGFNIFG